MKKIPALVFVVLVLFFGLAGSCKKGGGGGSTPTPNEANLQVVLNPPAGSNQAASLGPNFPLSVTISSAMPPQGVTIAVSAKVDGSSAAPFFTINQSTSGTTTNFSITNTPAATTALVTVTVTSKTKASNTWTGTYRYSRK
ncbi:MAG: hypothetical protein GC171_03545 [Terrimonas sp.]|nr:hypothetical protein [Terrimonas sp.]